jgi:hypothetical protein
MPLRFITKLHGAVDTLPVAPFYYLRTPDDGQKRPKHVVTECLNKLIGYIDNLNLSVIY